VPEEHVVGEAHERGGEVVEHLLGAGWFVLVCIGLILLASRVPGHPGQPGGYHRGGGPHGGTGYPLVRALALVACGTRTPAASSSPPAFDPSSAGARRTRCVQHGDQGPDRRHGPHRAPAVEIPASPDLVAQLPRTLNFRDFNDLGKFSRLPQGLSMDGVPTGDDPLHAPSAITRRRVTWCSTKEPG
jgi:hypothetical protein